MQTPYEHELEEQRKQLHKGHMWMPSEVHHVHAHDMCMHMRMRLRERG